MIIKTTIKSLVLMLILTSISFGQLSAIESFDYPVTTLAGMGGADNGFGGPWVNDEDGGIEGLVTIGNDRFAYGDLSWEVPHDTIHLQVVKSGAWSDHNRYKRPLAQLYPNTAGASYWVSYLLDIKEPLPVGNTYFMVKLYDGTSEILAIGKGGGADTPVFTCGSGWPGNAGDDLSDVEILGGPVWLVARIDMPGNATDAARTFMWIDPDPSAEPDTADAVVARNSTLTNGIDNIALEFGGDGADVRLIFDEIRIGDSFAAVSDEVTDVADEHKVPVEYSLSQNYPNPFNPSTTISFSVPQESLVSLRVFDILGREVALLANSERVAAGTYNYSFDASGLASGTYFYQLKTNNTVETRKMLLVK